MSTVIFKDFKDAVKKQVAIMTGQGSVFKTNLQKEELQEKYLSSFPEGTNPMFRERRVYDANYDLNFIGLFGGVVSFVDGKKTSVWDIEVGGYYQPVIDALREMVHNSEIVEPFYHYEQKVGVMDFNFETLENGDLHRWDHFFSPIPAPLVVPVGDLPSKLSKLRSYYQVLSRSLEEISLTSAEVVLDLIKEGNLYRGDEMKHRVELFISLKKVYDTLSGDELSLFLWSKVVSLESECRIRNTSIGTLLVDLSEGKELGDAVASFEDKISEGKYKRTSSVLTQAMISKAKDTVVSLGLEDALYRRYAKLNDLTINNVLFANRDARKTMNPFDVLSEKAHVSKKLAGSTEEISIDNFMKIVVPKANNIEVLVENKHINNLVSLIAPVDKSAGNILKWGNNFSWSYRGEVTDSLRERVSKAGGNVDGVLRCSLSWSNLDDLDIHVYLPNGRNINFNSKTCPVSGGRLDVDMNAYGRLSESPVENVFWKGKPTEGRYLVKVHNYAKRCTDPKKDGFQIEVDDNGESTLFGSDKNPVGGAYMNVVEFDYSHKDGVKFINKNGKGNHKSETVWGIQTNTFQKVNMIMNSPNHWDGECTGNKHLFFSLTNCRNEEESRGFYNEYLRGELYEHRKAFEMLGGLLKTPKSDDQVSGLGFSSTKRNEATFKVDGRLFKVLF